MSEEKNIPLEEIPQEQPVNKEPADETISSAEPVTEAEQRETNNEQQETRNDQTKQNMEVHHHTHSAHGKKNWRSYFWEFLMLFLAVFCGFLAEYQLEHVIEHQREKKYAATLYEDIKADTAALRSAIAVNIFVTSRIDTFRSMVQTQTLNSLPTGAWYYYGRFGTRYFHIAFQDATMEQLKNSGGLRYFKKHNVVNVIARYDQSRRDLQTILNFQDLIYNEIVKTRNQVFIGFYTDEIMDLNISTEIIDAYKKKEMPLLSTKKEDFIQYANLCQLRSYNNKYLMGTEQKALENAEKLLAVLKKEYNLE